MASLVPPSPEASSAAVVKVMRGNRKTGTGPELRFRQMLEEAAIATRENALILIDGRQVRPDFVLTTGRVTVFVDGCFWHSCPKHGVTPRTNTWYWKPKLERNQERDAAIGHLLSDAGWTVIRVWEHDLDDGLRRVRLASGGAAIDIPHAGQSGT
jgi:DNA mismatch endonuclease, patch repair protein